jgi:hypothetical protein
MSGLRVYQRGNSYRIGREICRVGLLRNIIGCKVNLKTKIRKVLPISIGFLLKNITCNH